MHLNGEKLLKCHLKEKSGRKWTVELNVYDSEIVGPQGLICSIPRVNIHVYYHMFKHLL